MEWIHVNNYKVPDLLHYLDDFLTAGPSDSSQCAQNLRYCAIGLRSFGLTSPPWQVRGGYSRVSFSWHRVRFPCSGGTSPWRKAAVQALKELIHSWLPRNWSFRRELESRIGHFHHAAKVVWPGRTFRRHMIDLITCFRKKDHPIRLNKEFHLDLQWWDLLLAEWHGVSFWLYPRLSPAVDLEAASNAAGSIGFGAYFKGFWFAGPCAVSQ